MGIRYRVSGTIQLPISFVFLVANIVLSIGPGVGGAFALTAGGWRWAFYFNLILVAVTMPVFMFMLSMNETSKPPTSLWARVQRLDALGSLLFAGALAVGITALSFGGALYPMKSGQIIGLFCCSAVLSISFGIQQTTAFCTSNEDRILPTHILRSWEMGILIVQTGCSIGMLFVIIYYVPLYFQLIRGESAIHSAIDLLPFLLSSVFTMLASGRLITRFGMYKIWFILGSSLALVMSTCLYTTQLDTSRWKIYGYLILGGTGIGFYVMNSGLVMSATVAKANSADASTIFGCADTISSTIAVAIANCLFVNQATNVIQQILPDTSRAVVQDAITGHGASLMNQVPSSSKREVLQATLDAIKDVWIQMIATAALSLVLSFFMRNRKLSNLSKI